MTASTTESLDEELEKVLASMKKRDWDALEHLFRMPFLRPEMAKALHYYLEYDGKMAMPVNYEANLEAARAVIAKLAGAPR